MLKVMTSAEREADLERRLKEAEEAAIQETNDKRDEVELSPEEKNYKKRYGDLRSHASRIENELRKEIDGLKVALASATKKEMEFPKTAAEVSAWAAKYPEIYDTIVTIARQNAIDVAKESAEKVAAIEAREYEQAKREAKAELIAAHSDFPDLATDQDFIDWVESQPKYIRDALYVNETDAASAIRAVDLYKSDRGLFEKAPAPEKRPDTREAARRVPPGESTTVNNGSAPKWTESKLANVNWNRLTDAQLAEIEEAQLNPAFYDISGGAR